MRRLTKQQILNGLKNFWIDLLGIDDDEAVFLANDNLIDWLRSLGGGIWEELDFAAVHFRLQNDLGVQGTVAEFDELIIGGAKNDEDWETFVKPTLTFGRFADWIVERVTIPDYAPVNITGTPCQQAGTFFTIQKVIKDVQLFTPRYGPSTPIRYSLRGRDLKIVWSRLSLHSGGELPPLHWPFAQFGCAVVILGALLGIVSSFAYLPGILVAGFLVLMGVIISDAGNPLPENISTFRDLSREMSKFVEHAG